MACNLRDDAPAGGPLPAGGDARPVAVLAAAGGLPLELADALRAAGRRYHLVGIEGIADARIAEHPHTWVGLGRLGGILRALRRTGARELVIIGAMTRPDLSRVGFDLGALRHAPAILALTRGGDDSMLRVVVRFFESQGFEVRGAGDVAPGLLAPEGVIAGAPPTGALAAAIERGRGALATLSRFDVGQAVVARPDGIVAFEAAEGTSRMLARLAAGGGAGADSVLVKLAKTGQEMRVDTPTIGAGTVAEATAAGLRGIAVGAGGTLVAERARLVADAAATGVFVYGLAASADGSTPVVGRGAGGDDELRFSARLGADAQLARALAAVAMRQASQGTRDIAVIVRREHTLALARNGLTDGTLGRLLETLPRGWGRWLTPRRAGVLAVAVTDLPAAAAAIAALAPTIWDARLGEVLIIFSRQGGEGGKGREGGEDPATVAVASRMLAEAARANGLGLQLVDAGEWQGHV